MDTTHLMDGHHTPNHEIPERAVVGIVSGQEAVRPPPRGTGSVFACVAIGCFQIVPCLYTKYNTKKPMCQRKKVFFFIHEVHFF